MSTLKEAAARRLPAQTRQRLKRRLQRVRWGNLRRFTPMSDVYGGDRGTPVDRVYIEDFLARHSDAIRGDVVEVLDPAYTRRFGGERVTTAHVLDVDASNPAATIVADLGVPDSLDEGIVDCVVLTQTLQLVPDVEAALRNVYRALRAGGSLLLTVPVSSKVEPSYPDLWRWTPQGLEHLVRRVLPDAETVFASYGNFLTVTAFHYALAAEELRDGEIWREDATYPLVTCARVTRPAG